jgi:protein O-mannosyl-transferase
MKEAQDHFRKTISLSPQYVNAYINLGNVLSQTGNYAEAIDAFLAALQMDSQNSLIHNNLGNSYTQTGNYINAIEHYTKSLQIDSGFVNAQRNLNRVLVLWIGKTNPAIAADELRNLINQFPHNAILHYHLGNLIANQQREESIKQYEAAVGIQPDYIDAIYSLAVAYADRGEYPRSISYFQKLVLINPIDSRFDYNISCLYARQGMKDEAIKWLQQALEKGYNNWEQIKTDRDLNNIRNTQYYQSLIFKNVGDR